MDLQQTLQKEISVFQQLQKDVEKSVKNRTKLESQLKENEGVNREFKILEKEEENEIYKLVGPVLVKQEKSEAINNVQKRIEFINTEIKRSETVIAELQEKMEKKKLEIVKLETAVQQNLSAKVLCDQDYSHSHNLDDSLYHSCPACSQFAKDALDLVDISPVASTDTFPGSANDLEEASNANANSNSNAAGASVLIGGEANAGTGFPTFAQKGIHSDALNAWVRANYLLLCRLAHLIFIKEAFSSRDTVLVIQVETSARVFLPPSSTTVDHFSILRFYPSYLDNVEKCCVDHLIYDSLKHSSLTAIGPYAASESIKIFIHDGYRCTSVSCLRSAVGKREEKWWTDQRLLTEISSVCNFIR